MKGSLNKIYCIFMTIMLMMSIIPLSAMADETETVNLSVIETDQAAETPVIAQNIQFSKKATGVYRTNIEAIGWQNWKTQGGLSGTMGQALRLEGIEIKTSDSTNLGVQYQVYVPSLGWQAWKSNGQMSGTEGQSLRMEAIRIRLTGRDATNYDVYYQVHAQNFGWLDWVKNGESAGIEGFGYRLEAIRILVVAKD